MVRCVARPNDVSAGCELACLCPPVTNTTHHSHPFMPAGCRRMPQSMMTTSRTCSGATSHPSSAWRRRWAALWVGHTRPPGMLAVQRPCGCTPRLRVLHAGRCAPDIMLCSPPSLSQLRLGEKRILRGTMDGVRRRLAPIRGIPTKVRCGCTAGLLLVDCSSPGEHWCLVRLRLLLLGALHPAAALDAVQCSSAAHTWGGSTCLRHSARPRSTCLPCCCLLPARRALQSGGMQDPNADLIEIFDTIEQLPSAPKKLLDGFGRWLSGKDDPDWKR